MNQSTNMNIQITRLEVRNFQAIAEADIAVSGNLIAFGHNGHSKSSLLRAVQMCLIGACAHTTRDGKDFQNIIRDGADHAFVAVEFTQDAVAYRAESFWYRGKKSNEFALLDQSGKQILDRRADLWGHLRINRVHAMITASPEAFLESQELGEALSDMLAGDITEDAVYDMCGMHDAWLRGFVSTHKLAMRNTADLARIGAMAEEDRTAVNRDLRTQEGVLADLPHVAAPVNGEGREIGLDDRDKLANQIMGIEKSLHDLHQERGRAADLDGVDINAAADSLAQAKQAADEAKQIWAMHEAKLREAEQAHSAANYAVHSAERDRATAKRDVDALESLGDCCPTCQQKISKKAFDALMKAARTNYDAADAAHSEAVQAAAEALARLTPAREAVKEAMQSHELAISRVRELQAVVDKAGSVRPVAAIDADIEATEARIQRGREIIATLDRMREKADIEAHIASLRERREHLDWAVEAFRDGAITKQFMDSGLDAFVALVNAELDLFGYTFGVDIQGKKIMPIMSKQGESRPVRLFSDGERLLAAFALAMAFASSGAPVILDNLNDLDARNRGRMIKRLMSHNAASVIVAAAWQQGAFDLSDYASRLAPCTVCWCDGGVITAGVDAMAGVG